MRALLEVKPTPEQLALFSRLRTGAEVIRGAAGSGKTTTAILKLRSSIGSFLNRKARQKRTDPLQILVLTYNRTLSGYISELVSQQFATSGEINVEVMTFGKWAMELLSYPALHPNWKNAITRLGAGLPLEPSFLLQEVEYVLGRFLPENLDDYLTVRRDGRGGTPRMERSQRQNLLDTVIKPYIAEKAAAGQRDWHDLAVELATTKIASYDIVIVDETQDFSANQVRAVMNQLLDTHSVTFILDTAQRIYARGFLWQEVGITVRSDNSFRLAKNYRNTRQIARFAAALIDGLSHDDDGTMPDFNSALRDGPLPFVYVGRFSLQVSRAIAHIRNNVDLANESVAFLHPLGGGWFKYLRAQLSANGIEFIELTREADWPDGDENVALSTLHSAKGLEFDHVFILGLNEEVTEHGEGDDDSQLHTLRRLVAMGAGRAKKTLAVGYCPEDASRVAAYMEPTTYTRVVL